MKFVIQRVTHAEVAVEGEVIGKIGKGFMVLIGVAQDDTRVIADKMVKKLTGLRIFEAGGGRRPHGGDNGGGAVRADPDIVRRRVTGLRGAASAVHPHKIPRKERFD